MYPLCPCHPFKRLLFARLLFFYHSVFADTRVSTTWLGAHLNDAQLTLVDMIDEIQYQRFHLPGALHFLYRALITTDLFVTDELIRILGLLGVSTDDHASRRYWKLEGLGHPRISLLDGGLVKWFLEGRNVSNETGQTRKTTYSPANK